VAQGVRMAADGADIVDVGGESTRPGADRVPVDEELRRVVPVVEGLVAAGVRVSVDTMRAPVARAAVDAGAVLVNDVSGGLADPDILSVVAEAGVGYVAMHWRGHSDVMDGLDRYDDVVAEVRDELASRIEAMRAAGVGDDQMVLDPGLGFAKVSTANWPLLAHLDVLMGLGCPILVGASRKRFLAAVLAPDGVVVDPESRDDATAAVTALAAVCGVWAVRVHKVRPSVDAARVASAWRAAQHGEGR
jgi:dihydropteroate synthase